MNSKIKHYLLGSEGSVILTGAIIVWTIVHLFFVWDGGSNQVFNWPDAHANYHFAHRIFSGQNFAAPLPYDPSEAVSHLATRSTRVIGSSLVPIGFWGLPVLYGLISKFLFLDIIVYIGVVAAAAGTYAWYRLCLNFMQRNQAIVATALLLIHPAWIYYTNESLLPNVLAVSTAIGACCCVYEYGKTQRQIYLYGLGALIALVVAVRPSELLWVGPLLATAVYFNRRVIRMKDVFVIFAGAGVLAAAWFMFQGSILPSGEIFGYRLPQLESARGILYGARLIAPFGFNLWRTLGHGVGYIGLIFWPFTLLSLIGMVRVFRGDAVPLYAQVFGTTLCIVSAVLLLHYGSGNLSNTPNPRELSIDNSFVRYFLPLYVCLLPFIANVILDVWNSAARRWRLVSTGSIFFVLGLFTLWVAVLEPVHGIAQKTRVLRGYDRVAAFIIAATPENSIIVTERGDKYVWPHRLVMVLPNEIGGYQALAYFAREQKVPLYLVSLILSDDGRAALNKTWSEYGFTVGAELFLQDDIGVYGIEVSSL